MFIGGLNWDTTDQSLQQYFEQFGRVSSCVIMREGSTGKSRGFAFLTFDDPAAVNEVMSREHFLDGKIVCNPPFVLLRPRAPVLNSFVIVFDGRSTRNALSRAQIRPVRRNVL